tara:strand:- start:68 stop:718 length:651 start_codon:yes stop_codon:yes gene_type:complete
MSCENYIPERDNGSDDSHKVKIDLTGLRERIAKIAYDKMIEGHIKQLEVEKRILKESEREKEKEYNEKVSNMILGTGNVPTIVGQTQTPNPAMNYDFVSFKEIHKKEPIEYLDEKKLDYTIHNPNKEESKLKEDMPISFLEIKEGEVEKGKEWYLKKDPKLPDGIAELMSRYNWGDLKYMPNKKQYKNKQKKLKKQGGDILNILEVKKGNFKVSFD